MDLIISKEQAQKILTAIQQFPAKDVFESINILMTLKPAPVLQEKNKKTDK